MSNPADVVAYGDTEAWEKSGWQSIGGVYVAPVGTPMPGDWRLERRNWRIGRWKLLEVGDFRVRLHGFTWYDAWTGAYLRHEKIDGYSSIVTLYILFRRFVPISVSWVWSWRYEGDPLRDGVFERVRRWIAGRSPG